MTLPDAALVEDLDTVPGDILVLGVGGKMGPTLARMAKRAAPDKRVIGVARFSEAGLESQLNAAGIETIACDLTDRAAVAALPKVENVIFMAGRKFGSTGAEPLTWAMNVHVPGIVGEAFPEARIVAFSTACVYPYVDIRHGGAKESVAPVAPSGEYANSCVGRERIFEYLSEKHGTPGRLIRLSYAIDLRYGVLHDIAVAVRDGQPVPLGMGHVNVIWQGDANACALRALAHCTTPTTPLNVSGPEVASVRALALGLGERLGKAPLLEGEEADTAWLVNTAEQQRLFGYPSVPLAKLLDWTADWVSRGGRSLNKPTHFETRGGSY
ncbi:MAG: NAD(P)-dependent oxidoreductase [Rhodospirillaceae bacterium]|nr:NAD(P)-dependent oxidoreductase [Rhodospirillaceae bacterium]